MVEPRKKELDNYINDSLKRFIQFHLDEGYSKDSVIKCLKKYGYSQSELRQISNSVVVNPKKIEKEYSSKDLDKEAYYYLRGILSKYIHEQKHLGFSEEDAKKALIKYGHPKEIVTDAYLFLYSKKDLKVSKEALMFSGLFVIFAFVFILSNTLSVSFMDIFRLFSPAFGALMLTYILADKLYYHKNYCLPFIIGVTLTLYIGLVGFTNTDPLNDVVILLLNIGLGIISSLFFILIHIPKPKIFKEQSKKKSDTTSNKKITKKEKKLKSIIND